MAGWTGLEPAASGVTGRRSNQLNYHPVEGFRSQIDDSDCELSPLANRTRHQFAVTVAQTTLWWAVQGSNL